MASKMDLQLNPLRKTFRDFRLLWKDGIIQGQRVRRSGGKDFIFGFEWVDDNGSPFMKWSFGPECMLTTGCVGMSEAEDFSD
jgi:hypothetical protein